MQSNLDSTMQIVNFFYQMPEPSDLDKSAFVTPNRWVSSNSLYNLKIFYQQDKALNVSTSQLW